MQDGQNSVTFHTQTTIAITTIFNYIVISQCGHFQDLLSLRYYAKYVLEDLDMLKILFFCHIRGFEFG